MALVDPKAGESSSSTVTAHHLFVVVIDGVETSIHEGSLQASLGGTVTITSAGNLSASGVRSVVVRGGGGGQRQLHPRGPRARGPCRSRGSAPRTWSRPAGCPLERCREARVRGGGALRAARCRRADVESFGEVHLARCKGARVDWCGSVEVEMCRAVDVSRCGAVTGGRCRVVSAVGCGSVEVAHAVVNILEEEQPQAAQHPVSPSHSSRSSDSE
ncbi:hypothetical protein OsJ_11436 [Oryza sativa Japonica Group]|uniref:Uncharacterized protein n=1 Tax=Oryza sativa subsp. japonica TaxID=39947 RepID=B9F9A2_ORYSJ|nr:hypothetical protein OsJ_11436 [Oryza sativa Japonica Group]